MISCKYVVCFRTTQAWAVKTHPVVFLTLSTVHTCVKKAIKQEIHQHIKNTSSYERFDSINSSIFHGFIQSALEINTFCQALGIPGYICTVLEKINHIESYMAQNKKGTLITTW